MEKHPSHLENIPRLNRIAGQIEGIKKMIEEGRYCPEIISQLRAKLFLTVLMNKRKRLPKRFFFIYS